MGNRSTTRSRLTVVWGYYLNGIPNIKEATMDKTRKYDIIELYEARVKARSGYERDMIDKTLDRIMRENGAVREIRENLVMAIRTGDLRAMSRFQHELNVMTARETFGKGK